MWRTSDSDEAVQVISGMVYRHWSRDQLLFHVDVSEFDLSLAEPRPGEYPRHCSSKGMLECLLNIQGVGNWQHATATMEANDEHAATGYKHSERDEAQAHPQCDLQRPRGGDSDHVHATSAFPRISRRGRRFGDRPDPV